MSTQPEALRLAETLEQQFPTGTAQNFLDGEAAAELRRLHSVNAELLGALEFCAGTSYATDANDVARAAIARAEGETK